MKDCPNWGSQVSTSQAAGSLNYESMWAHENIIDGGPNLGLYIYIIRSEKDAYKIQPKKLQPQNIFITSPSMRWYARRSGLIFIHM